MAKTANPISRAAATHKAAIPEIPISPRGLAVLRGKGTKREREAREEAFVARVAKAPPAQTMGELGDMLVAGCYSATARTNLLLVLCANSTAPHLLPGPRKS